MCGGGGSRGQGQRFRPGALGGVNAHSARRSFPAKPAFALGGVVIAAKSIDRAATAGTCRAFQEWLGRRTMESWHPRPLPDRCVFTRHGAESQPFQPAL